MMGGCVSIPIRGCSTKKKSSYKFSVLHYVSNIKGKLKWFMCCGG